jgi:phytoene dehydrogenase-like protein
VNLALDGLPDFTAPARRRAAPARRDQLSPSVDYMERAYDDAKYGSLLAAPYIDMSSRRWSTRRWRRRASTSCCFVQYAPYHLEDAGRLGRPARGLRRHGRRHDRRAGAEHRDIILHRQVLTPLDIERDHSGLTEGNIFQGELSLEQLFFSSAGPRLGALPDAGPRAVAVRLVAHPGGGIMGAPGAYRLLRWVPMPVADLVSEFFETGLLQAAFAARAVHGTGAGPRSAGTGALLLLHSALDPSPAGSSLSVKGGPGALGRALAEAAREAGAVIRLDTPVSRVTVLDGQATGVLLEDGTEIPGDAVVSNADPKRTLLGMVDPGELGPTLVERLRHYRSAGTVARVNLVLGELPAFAGIDGPEVLRGRLHIGPDLDALERAFDASKYGHIPSEPYLDVAIPSLLDSSLCPPGRHVLSVHAQWTPYALAAGGERAALGDHLAQVVLDTLERYAPGISGLIEHRQVLTPADLEARYSLTGGHIHHGELSIDQLFAMRPVAGCAQYRTPIRRLFLCGAGDTPGPRRDRRVGEECGHGDPEGTEVRRGNVKLTELRTPCVLVDQSKVDRNVDRMQAVAETAGVRLRPHAKTHKSPDLALLQVARGAVGICCAKLGEAEVFADAGIRPTSAAVSAAPVQRDRVLALLDRTRLSFIVDHPTSREAWSAPCARGPRGRRAREGGRGLPSLRHRPGRIRRRGPRREVAALPGLRFGPPQPRGARVPCDVERMRSRRSRKRKRGRSRDRSAAARRASRSRR